MDKVLNDLNARQNEAAETMKPFRQLEVTDFDQAYVLAALQLAEGKKAEGLALLDKFPAASLNGPWQKRYETLRARLLD